MVGSSAAGIACGPCRHRRNGPNRNSAAAQPPPLLPAGARSFPFVPAVYRESVGVPPVGPGADPPRRFCARQDTVFVVKGQFIPRSSWVGRFPGHGQTRSGRSRPSQSRTAACGLKALRCAPTAPPRSAALTPLRAGAPGPVAAPVRFSAYPVLPTVHAPIPAPALSFLSPGTTYVGSNPCSLVVTAQAIRNSFRAAAQRATFTGLPRARNRV